ncbi:MAG: ATP-binding protein, partial [Solirubrobacteraceae bacterium]
MPATTLDRRGAHRGQGEPLATSARSPPPRPAASRGAKPLPTRRAALRRSSRRPCRCRSDRTCRSRRTRTTARTRDLQKALGWVRVRTAVEDKRARLVVENGGPVLDADQVRQLTQPFRRIGAERTRSDDGSGLGLAIVSSILEVHGGTLELQALTNGGLRITI